MDTVILERTDNPAVISRARSILTSQTSGIQYMEDLLTDRRPGDDTCRCSPSGRSEALKGPRRLTRHGLGLGGLRPRAVL